MAAPQNHWKLGIFVVAGAILLLATVAVLGALSMYKEVGLYVSYFDESVQGLDVGSPIKFRGVTIGTVGRIEVASDHRHVEVESELGVKELTRLGLDIAPSPKRLLHLEPRKLEMAPDLRLQLASSGLTGVKFLQLDFFDVTAYPPPVLPFAVPENYIPTAPSMMKNLEDSITRMANTLPEITDKASAILSQINIIVAEVSDLQVPAQIATALEAANDLIATAQKRLGQVDTQGISDEAKRTMASLTAAVDRVDGLLARLEREDGLLARVEHIGSSVGDLLRGARGAGGQVVDTLGSLQSVARSIRKLTEALEQDPDMLVKGRAPEKKR